MTLISAPEPNVNIYEDGFLNICNLERASQGKNLSELVEKISEPMVVALDAPWGAGKSVFLKCWVGAHRNENKGTALTIYFDAFRHDFMDEPLIGLTAAISDRIGDKKETKYWQKAKESAVKLVKPAVRIGLAVGTAGATEVAGVIFDAGIEAASDELKKATTEFWKKEDSIRAAMKSFRLSLEELAKEEKLVIVVDELDRCRPDYALNLLETIKHFFDVPNVHFVLGVNLDELSKMVSARYGSNSSGKKYLQKFITITMPLTSRSLTASGENVQLRHFRNVCAKIGLTDWKYDTLRDYLKLIDPHFQLTLRDVEKIATLAMITPSPPIRPRITYHIYCGIIILKIIQPESIDLARSGELSFRDLKKVFFFSRDSRADSFAGEMFSIWAAMTADHSRDIAIDFDHIKRTLFEEMEPVSVLRDVILRTVDVFKLYE